MPADIQIQASDGLAAPEATAVLDLVRRAASADGVGPLSEHARLHVRYGGEPGARDLLLRLDEQLAGYAHLDPPDPESGSSGELIIDPGFRDQGLGLALIRALIAEAGGHALRLWAHGDLPAADRLAVTAGFERTRTLYQMRRPLTGEIAEPHVAEGVEIRTFQVGQDEDAWVAINHKAFASHPEQGSWTRADLDLREREPWFNPAGFFLADRDGRLAGFHWTKIHDSRDADDDPAGAEPIGEVYVVGVDPQEQGTGLGRALTLIGLHYLRDRGLPAVMLYVDGDNTPAIRLYETLGFTRWRTDVMFTRQPGMAR
ncbi:MAG TPA: mycothiol synthase [Streptosporangiaceae bacterium]|nr:mycothiol synthase [Streptosporangiaceae bacterium]